MKLTLPYPPTANLYWRCWRGRIVKSPAARAYQERIKFLARSAYCLVLAVPCRVRLEVYRPRRIGDLDNTLKVLLDALKGVAYTDDKHVAELHATRHDDKANPRVEVQIEVVE